MKKTIFHCDFKNEDEKCRTQCDGCAHNLHSPVNPKNLDKELSYSKARQQKIAENILSRIKKN